MQFYRDGYILEPFRFSEAAKRSIIDHFPPKEKKIHGCVEEYIARTEGNLEYWLSAREIRTPAAEYRDRLERIIKFSDALMNELERLPADCCESLNSESMLVLPSEEMGDVAAFELQDIEAELLGCLRALNKTAKEVKTKIESQRLTPGKDRSEIKTLVSWLIDSYFDVFGKWPPTTITNNENGFHIVLGVDIAGVINQPIGVKLFQSILKDRKIMASNRVKESQGQHFF